jgi:fucose permease
LEHGLFSLARIVGPPLGTMLLSSSSSSSTALSFFGIVASSDTVGLWRVIAMCTIMDIVLMICLYSWSSKRLQHSLSAQQKKASDDDDEEESDGDDRGVHIPLLDMSGSSSDKDHSD